MEEVQTGEPQEAQARRFPSDSCREVLKTQVRRPQKLQLRGKLPYQENGPPVHLLALR